MVRLNLHVAACLMNHHCHRLAGSQIIQVEHAQPIIHFNLVVVFRIGKRQWQDALLLEIRLVNARKLFVMTARTFKNRGDIAACSRLLPSP